MVWREPGRPSGRRITGVDSAGRRIVWIARDHVFTATLRGPARLVARNAERQDLGLEDDRTLRWFRALRVAYEDLRPFAGDGCPVRRRFRVLAESSQAVVSRADYGTVWDEDVEVVRLCSRANRNDPVVLQPDSGFAAWHVP
jgi:hypothetical protein